VRWRQPELEESVRAGGLFSGPIFMMHEAVNSAWTCPRQPEPRPESRGAEVVADAEDAPAQPVAKLVMSSKQHGVA
jgi:hypothetical protein